MSSTQTPVPPSVMWAQRPLEVLLTINLEDCKDPDVKFEKDSVLFKGTGGVDQKPHEVKIPLFKEIDPEKSKSYNRGRCIELSLIKANPEGPYWPSLTSDGKKHHWLKCDFNKWQDEDESGDESAGGMPGMGGMGGMPGMGGMGGMPGMGGMGGGGDLAEMMRQMGGLGGGAGSAAKPSFDDFEANEDSDDEDLPDLE